MFSDTSLKAKFSVRTVVLVRMLRVKLEASLRLGGKLMGTCRRSAKSSAPVPIPCIGAAKILWQIPRLKVLNANASTACLKVLKNTPRASLSCGLLN